MVAPRQELRRRRESRSTQFGKFGAPALACDLRVHTQGGVVGVRRTPIRVAPLLHEFPSCHGIAKQYAGMRIQSMAVQRGAFNREKSSQNFDGPICVPIIVYQLGGA